MSITPEEVQKLLQSQDYGEKIRGLNQLRHLDISIAYELLKPLVKDKNERVRYAAVSQLAMVGRANPTDCLELLKDVLYHDPEVDVRAAAADSLAGLGLKEAFSDLKQVYQQTEDWLLRFSIIAALGELGVAEGFELLLDALNSGNPLLQTTAISALGELGDKRAVPFLLPFVENSDWQIRYRLTQALGRLKGEAGGVEVRAALEKLAQDEVDIIATEAKNYL
ncbi:MAG: HEAT repeat domain-containing protein [Geminocystis sp.]|nr:HEAT repeat domain-containing protein [Geminocystis sp.]HIK36871.1 HEAT repeat domain-containing protein [Geminocystis sp. M7585_C2015_104]MCS7148515.1 HEAT repeat domain-containing protein [Geminocystis sp.]MCX8079471.1 HEAT repeat domain-containing protein [Geminocystis sp.]MDW8114912.1 HEAT repeat domain-containing protein [Geminocystis sp.]